MSLDTFAGSETGILPYWLDGIETQERQPQVCNSADECCYIGERAYGMVPEGSLILGKGKYTSRKAVYEGAD